MLKSTGAVRRIIEKDGKFLVSFPEHDGYFTVPPSLRAMMRDAQKNGNEIDFTYDINLHITDAKAG